MFDYIIIDAPPLGIFTDANVLMSRADGALLVVRAGKTRYSQSTSCWNRCRASVCWEWF
jgi:Mrp family chromosome partitioning ATPase